MEEPLNASARTGDVTMTVQANYTNLCRISGKPRSMLSLLISEMRYSIIITYIVALSLGVGCKHLLHWLPIPCPYIVTLNPM